MNRNSIINEMYLSADIRAAIKKMQPEEIARSIFSSL
jgi:hypothetical protein